MPGLSRWYEGALPSVQEIRDRLRAAIPDALDPRGWATREMAARVVFVMLYGFAVEGEDGWIRPTAVTDMSDDQAVRQGTSERREWLERVQGRRRPRDIPGRWYSENSREGIRDETLRRFLRLGVAVEREGCSVTASVPRYALAADFAGLLDPALGGRELDRGIRAWQEVHLSPEARARVALLKQGAASGGDFLDVRLPNGEVRKIGAGKSGVVTKAVVEEFAPRFLCHPAVVLISESARKITHRDDAILKEIGLPIDPRTTLPDVILVDLGVNPPMLVFVEAVATDGPVDEWRMQEFADYLRGLGFEPTAAAFVSAFEDRRQSPFGRVASSLSWGSFAWFRTELKALMVLADERQLSGRLLADLSRSPEAR